MTAYDQDVSFSSDDDQVRVFGATGLRLNTAFQRVDNGAESRLLGIHRLRHIVEPRVVAWYGYSDIPDGDLPVFDESVESVGGASVVEVGLRNTFQTQRGGPGRWNPVDFLEVDECLSGLEARAGRVQHDVVVVVAARDEGHSIDLQRRRLRQCIG